MVAINHLEGAILINADKIASRWNHQFFMRSHLNFLAVHAQDHRPVRGRELSPQFVHRHVGPLFHHLAHAANLVLPPAAAWARLVAANALRAVADRFLLLLALLAAGDGGLLLTFDALLAGLVLHLRRRFVD